MADDQPGLGRDLSHNLAGVLLAGSPDPAEYAEVHQQTSSTIDENRQRFSQNQQRAAMEVAERAMAGSIMLLLLVTALVLAYSVAGVLFFIFGCSTYLDSGYKSCDQPLETWLLMMLLTIALENVIQCCAQCSPKITFAFFCVKLCLLCLGFWWRSNSITCSETDPDLFKFVTSYMIYKSVGAVFSFLSLVGISLIICMIHFDIWPFGSTQTAGRPGLIQELRTVEYSPGLFQRGDVSSENQPPECSICHDEFNAENTIKMTPCGHYFHEACLEQWLSKYSTTCPLCRQNLEEAVDANMASGTNTGYL